MLRTKRPKLFAGFTPAEQRELSDRALTYLVLHRKLRGGEVASDRVQTTEEYRQEEGAVGFRDDDLVGRMSDAELDALIEIKELNRQADATSGPTAIKLYKQILKRAPWDEIAMMSIGVEYAQAGQFPTAISWLERAAKANPDDNRVKKNLAAVKAAAGK